jgi:hypothetical protein
VRLGHPVADRVLRQDDPRDDHEPVSVFGSQEASVVDRDGVVATDRLLEESALLLSSRHEREHRSARGSKKRTGLGPHPRWPKIEQRRGFLPPYVRRSGIIDEALREYASRRQRALLRRRLAEGARRNAARDLELAGEGMAAAEEAWELRRR